MDKQHRQELLQNLDLVAIFEQIHEGFAICDADGKMLYITENMEKMFHTTVENVIGKVNDEIGISKPAVTDRVIEEKRKISTRQENRFGEEFFITGVPIFDGRGEVKYVVSYNSWEVTNGYELAENYKRLQRNNTRILNEITMLNYTHNFDYRDMIIRSNVMKNTVQMLKKVADNELPVFLGGAEGCGKKFLAGYIHHISNRSRNVLFAWNPDEVKGISQEEDLFGTKDSIGLLEMCDGGVVIIENVEKLSFSLQNKLKHFIETKSFYTIQGEKREADIKLIFTSVHSVLELLEENLISNELYYAIGLIDVNIPSLSKRPEDLAGYLDYFLNYFNEKYGKNVQLNGKAKAMLMAYDWPQNVKEVQFIMERIVLLNENKTLSAYDLPDVIVESFGGKMEAESDLKNMLEFYEGQIIARAYKRCGTSVAVAKELNISQASAFRKLKKYIPDYQSIQ